MNHVPRLIASLALALLLAGCTSQPPKGKVPVGPKTRKDTKDPSAFDAALKLFRYPDNPRVNDDWTRFRDGTQMLAAHFTQPEVLARLNLPEDERAFLERELQLSEEELAEVMAFSFRPADAHYLDECFLLRDAARSLDVPGMKPLQVADHHFRWVMRNVYLHQQVDPWAPPAFTLRRGHGNAIERALVYLALLRQANLEGCLLVVPEAEPTQVLVGVLIEADTPGLHLFDPRLGLPVAGADGKSIATLKEVQADPGLLKPSLIGPDDVKKLEPRLATSLYAFAPRMLELQRGLGEFDQVVLHASASRLAKDLATASGRPVKAWGTPTRALRQFLPRVEGGTDERNRLLLYQEALLPSQRIKLQFARIGIEPELMPTVAYQALMRISYNLLFKFSVQTRELQLRGMYEPVLRRQERLQHFTKHEGLSNNPEFLKDLREWQRELRKAMEVDPQDFEKGQKYAQALVFQDPFIAWLGDLDNERAFSRELKRTVVTGILAIALEEYLDSTMALDQGMRSQEKAVAASARLAAMPAPTRTAKTKAEEAWNHASTAWSTSYLEQMSLNQLLNKRLESIRLLDKLRRNPLEDMHARVGLLEDLHRELHQYFEAKLRLAETIEHLEGAASASTYRGKIQTELGELRRTNPVGDALKAARAQLGALPANNPKTQFGPRTLWQNRIDLLASDWNEQGAWFWLQQNLKQREAK